MALVFAQILRWERNHSRPLSRVKHEHVVASVRSVWCLVYLKSGRPTAVRHYLFQSHLHANISLPFLFREGKMGTNVGNEAA